VALVTFGIGLLAVSFWVIASIPSQRADAEARQNEIKSVRPSAEYSIGSRDDLMELFRKLVESSGKKNSNTFYVSKIETDGNNFWLYVYWEEDNSILTLPLPFDKTDETYLVSVYGNRKQLNEHSEELVEKCVSTGMKYIQEINDPF
jgi:quinol monooxygenase YgiN